MSCDQVSPLGELTVRWTGAEEGDIEITDEFDGADAADDDAAVPSEDGGADE